MKKNTIKQGTKAIIAGLTFSLSGFAFATDTWDMPLAYSASNYNSVIDKQFADQVSAAQTEIKIETHPGGSLFKGGGNL